MGMLGCIGSSLDACLENGVHVGEFDTIPILWLVRALHMGQGTEPIGY